MWRRFSISSVQLQRVPCPRHPSDRESLYGKFRGENPAPRATVTVPPTAGASPPVADRLRQPAASFLSETKRTASRRNAWGKGQGPPSRTRFGKEGGCHGRRILSKETVWAGERCFRPRLPKGLIPGGSGGPPFGKAAAEEDGEPDRAGGAACRLYRAGGPSVGNAFGTIVAGSCRTRRRGCPGGSCGAARRGEPRNSPVSWRMFGGQGGKRQA